MGQKQFITYQADVLSFEAMEATMGVLYPGRYCGFTTMVANGLPSTGNVPITLSHVGGVQKLPKNATTLNPAIGVVITTQGVIIHEDLDINVSLIDNSGGGDIKYSIVYMEHTYQDGVPGPNPAVFGVVNGTPGGGIPALPNAYKRVIIGLVEMAPAATTVADMKWLPKPAENQFGDTNLLQRLFGTGAEYDINVLGVISGSSGILGRRLFSEENYVTNNDNFTTLIDKLDIQLYVASQDALTTKNRAIDSPDWAELTDIPDQNVSIARHGLLPKLPNDALKFFNGVGTWAAINALLTANNLSELIPTSAIARANLNVLSGAEIEAAYFHDTGWQLMTPQVAASAAGFNVRVRRIGRLIIIQGRYASGANMAANAAICLFPWASLALPSGAILKNTTDIFASSESGVDDRRVQVYIPTYVFGNVNLVLQMYTTTVGAEPNHILNFSFFVD